MKSHKKSLLVDKGMSIGPQEQDCKSKDQNMTYKSKQMVFHQFKENPYCSGQPKHAR
jgi:hypothetical protein